METINIDKKAITELVRLTHEVSDRIESLELMSDSGFMKSLDKSKEQIKKREFADWDEL
ncbi:MAG: hypothetical protein KKF67_01725 [Nanoarchaeota archaeon]|nr:hypothetical protein [Nanoarchaeota archaeon]